MSCIGTRDVAVQDMRESFRNNNSALYYIVILAEIPGVARDSIRNEGNR
jgi:hypothetical protein